MKKVLDEHHENYAVSVNTGEGGGGEGEGISFHTLPTPFTICTWVRKGHVTPHLFPRIQYMRIYNSDRLPYSTKIFIAFI